MNKRNSRKRGKGGIMEKTIMRLDCANGAPYRDEDYDYVFVCGTCGNTVLGLPRYCPGCGREVDMIASDERL